MRLILLVLTIALVFLIPALIVGDRFDLAIDGERALEFIRAQGGWAGLVGAGLIVADLNVPIPSSANMAALGLIFGSLIGAATASVASFIAATIGYSACALTGPRAAPWIAGEAEIQRVSGFFARFGLWAIALSRWLPAIPELLACLAGLTRMSFVRFSIGNAIGSLGVGFSYAYFGAQGAGDPAKALAAAAIIPYLALPFFFAFIARKGGTAPREQKL
jgi:uncharacterized membrane protein YdjX (TVP38/TMEM64 family)